MAYVEVRESLAMELIAALNESDNGEISEDEYLALVAKYSDFDE